ncbi:MAG: hemolysin family protein [Acidobacteriaceae bacterium]
MVRLLLLRALIIVLLVAANAFFVAAEFALVSIRETRIQRLIEQGNFAARSVLRLHGNIDKVLAAVQLGVTFASLALGWVGEPAIAGVLEPFFGGLAHAVVFAHVLAVLVAFTVITYFHVILGEIVPKQLALHRAERVALAIATPMEIFMRTMQPFLVFMSGSARLVLNRFGTPVSREGGVHSADELKMMVVASRNLGFLPALQEQMVRRALDLDSVTAREIMTPRQSVFALPADMRLEEAEARVVTEQHSRVPVYDPAVGPEQVVGLLYSKDIARFLLRRAESRESRRVPLAVQHVMRDVLVVPETKIVTELLQEFKAHRRELAAVVDEFGTTVGVVTIEDILEELVGEMEDEFDVAEAATTLLLSNGEAVLDGAANLRDLETSIGLTLPKDEGYETLAGFVLARLGRIPQGGEFFTYEQRRYTVLSMEKLRVSRVKVEALGDSAARDAAEGNG